jgi:hypothetical protein
LTLVGWIHIPDPDPGGQKWPTWWMFPFLGQCILDVIWLYGGLGKNILFFILKNMHFFNRKFYKFGSQMQYMDPDPH